MMLPDISRQRGVAYFLQSACQVAHARGRDDEALEYCRDLVFHAQAMGRQPAVVAMLVSIGIDNMTFMSIWNILPTLRLDDPATRQAAIGLIHDLLDDGGVRAGAVRSIYAERAAQLDTVRRMGDGTNLALGTSDTPLESFLVWWFRPIIEDDARTMIADTTSLAQAVGAPDAVTSRRLMPAAPTAAGGTGSFSSVMLHPVSRALVPSLGAAIQRTYVAQSDRRAAAVYLAAKLYELDRDRLASQIADLVPDYLAQVPIDPTTGAAMVLSFTPTTTQVVPK